MGKLDNKRFMVCCANGAGSSLLMKLNLQKTLKKLGATPASLHHCALSEGRNTAGSYDVVFCARSFTHHFADAEQKGTVVLGLKNIMSQAEMEAALKEAGLLD